MDLKRGHAAAGLLLNEKSAWLMTYQRSQSRTLLLIHPLQVSTGQTTAAPADNDIIYSKDIAEQLIADANATGEPDDEGGVNMEPMAPSQPPLAPSAPAAVSAPLQTQTAASAKTSILQKHLFKYPSEHGPLPDLEPLSFYWKGGMKGLDQEVVLLEMGGDGDGGEDDDELND